MNVKAPYILAALLAASAGVTLLFWYQVTFSRRLSDEQLLLALAPTASVRQVEHGIEEVTKRFDERAPGMDRWVALLLDASRREETALRRAAAWAMQYGATREDCATRLREMVNTDRDVAVTRNAACSLSLAADASGRGVLRSMLVNFTVTAPADGSVASVLSVGRRAEQDGAVAKIEVSDGARVEASAPVPGRVTAVLANVGATVTVGAPLVELAPDPDHAIAAATALALVGTQEDLDLLRELTGPQAPAGPRAQTQAREAILAIERRLKAR